MVQPPVRGTSPRLHGSDFNSKTLAFSPSSFPQMIVSRLSEALSRPQLFDSSRPPAPSSPLSASSRRRPDAQFLTLFQGVDSAPTPCLGSSPSRLLHASWLLLLGSVPILSGFPGSASERPQLGFRPDLRLPTSPTAAPAPSHPGLPWAFGSSRLLTVFPDSWLPNHDRLQFPSSRTVLVLGEWDMASASLLYACMKMWRWLPACILRDMVLVSR